MFPTYTFHSVSIEFILILNTPLSSPSCFSVSLLLYKGLKRMETLGTFLDGEWESIFNDFPRQIASQHDSDIANYLPNAFVSPLDYLNGSENERFDLLFVDDGSLSMNFCAVDVENGGSLSQFFLQDMNNETILANEVSSDSLLMNLASPCFELPRKRKDASEFRGAAGGKIRSIAASEKKSRVSRATKKGKKKMASEKEHVSYNRKDEEGAIVGLELQSISHESSDNESNASQEINRQKDSESEEPVVVNSQGKKRASRGAATDPQSFYARKRRMRINERLKILQNLVPNGAKVDISTMLEEAFNYVKFLQLQIKLLSSDELWMFAPLAYDGHNTSLYEGDSPFVSP